MSRAEKAAFVDGSDRLVWSNSAISSHWPITAVSLSRRSTRFRRTSFLKAGVHYEVIKNKLAKRAIAGSKRSSHETSLSGMTAWIISGDDPIDAAKVLKAEIQELVKKEVFTCQGRLLRWRGR